MPGSVFVARDLPADAMAILEAAGDVEVHRGPQLAPAALVERLSGKDALVCQLTQKIDAAVLNATTRLGVVANVAVGYDNIDVEAATKRGIVVTNTPGVLDDTTADFTWALLLGVARRIMDGERMIREEGWPGWDLMQLLGTDVHGKTLGIVGLGNIGRKVAARARGFDMRIIYAGRRRVSEDIERELGAEHVSQDELLARSDFLTLHIPLRDSTRHLIDAAALKRMKPSAYLINTARGPVVDEEALVAALRDGEIRGAALDVFEREPKIHPGLLELPNVLLAPHLGSASIETRTRMAVMAAQNVAAVLAGERPPNPVNPSVLDAP